MTLTGKVADYCRREGFPLDRAGSVLCAVSGGVDSMCLLHLLWVQSRALGFALSAATFDHRLRPDAQADVRFVRDWCAAHGIPCETGQGDVAGLAREQGLTLEEAGRLLRYQFLETCRRAAGAHFIATAHNADDNAETLLLHLLRGTGLQGLGGIPPRRDRIIRPLLSCTRGEIAAYCAREGVPHREDETNADPAYTRNYLRHQVLPLLREKNPNLTATLCRTAESLRRDGAYLEDQAQEAARALLREDGRTVSVSVPELLALPIPLSLRVVQEMARRVRPGTVLPHQQRLALLTMARDKKVGKISLTNRLQGRLVYDMLVLSPPCSEGGTFAPRSLLPGQSRTLPELGLTVSCEILSPSTPRVSGPHCLTLRPPDRGPLVIRPREVGDRIRLPGRPEKTLKKLLQEARIPPEDRERVPVLVLEGTVAAVWGFGVDCRWAPLPGRDAWQILFTKTDAAEKGQV